MNFDPIYLKSLSITTTLILLGFAFVLTFLIALKYMSSLNMHLPDLSKSIELEKTWENRLLARKYIIYSGLGLFLLAFVLGVLAEIELSNIGIIKDKASDFPTLEEIRSNWPNFRGPEGIGIAYNTKVPTKWNGKSGENIF